MKIAILGHGVVGSGVRQIIEAKKKEEIEIISILVKDQNEVNDERFTTDAQDILNNPEIETVIECMGGDEPAHSYVKTALEKGKNVISANKKMLSNRLDLFETAEKNNVKLLIEASCGGGIPWLINLRRIRRNDDIKEISGILNGTTNYLLSRLFSEDISFEEALKNAQKLGYAERDPSDDICGYDVRYKLDLSIYEAFDLLVDNKEIPTYGISAINDKDIAYAKKNGCTIKLVARASYENDKLNAIVMPVMLKKDTVFANISSNYNIVECVSDYLGKADFIGQGAGSFPTGHAIVQDLIDLCEGKTEDTKHKAVKKNVDNDFDGIFYIRHNKTDVFEEYTDERIAEDSFITCKCAFRNIERLFKENEDEKMFIMEVEG